MSPLNGARAGAARDEQPLALHVHRVVNPGAEAADANRLSIVMFTGPNRDAVVACLPGCEEPGQAPRYAPILAAEHSAMKHAEAFARAGRTASDQLGAD